MLTRGGGASSGSGSAGGGGRLGIGGPPGSVAVPMPDAGSASAGGQLEGRAGAARAIGWILRHRRQLVISYLVVLHALVYVLSALLSRCRHPTAGGAR